MFNNKPETKILKMQLELKHNQDRLCESDKMKFRDFKVSIR